ncbi:MAG TPA: outer membrane beta-barrel protein [Gemmatimonadales bacterium]|nr:outer membrane beta-barrel protein [Gemmatimonadales bacterium]
MSILKLTKVPAILAAAAFSAAVPAKAVAQGVDLVPWVGAYIPTRNSVSDVLNNALSRDVSVVGGARLTFWGSGHLGLEAVGGYAPAKISGETINETNTNMLIAAGRLMLALSPADSRVGFYLAGGPALITRGKNPFDNNKSSTDFGANVGAGFRFGLGQSNATALRLDLEDYMYNGDFGGGNKFQHDLVASLGLAIPIGGHHNNNGSQ